MTEPSPFDSEAEKLAAAQIAERDKLEAEEARADLRWVMNHVRGRRFMRRLIDISGVYRGSFTGNSETFFREGERSVGIQVLRQIQESCPDKFLVMLTEQQQTKDDK